MSQDKPKRDDLLRLPDINKLTIAGRLTRDPDKRDAGAHEKWEFSLAVNKRYKSGDEWMTTTHYHRVVAWDRAAEPVKKLHKGDPVMIDGSLSREEWLDRDEKKQSKTRIEAHKVWPLAWTEQRETQRVNPFGSDARREDLDHTPPPEEDIPF